MINLIYIFAFSMIVALSGALVPGPLLTYTVIKTLETQKRSFLTGFYVIAGHAFIEGLIIVGILKGLSLILKNPIIVKSMGILGGGFLIYMGIDIVIKIAHVNLRTAYNNSHEKESINNNSILRISNPLLGGALISMSNPYWWIWWATIGFGFMLQYNISLINLKGLSSLDHTSSFRDKNYKYLKRF